MDKISVLKDLVKFNTIKDKNNINIINYIENFLLNLNFKTIKKDKYLIMSCGENCDLGFLGHTDTVDFTSGWENNPFELIEKNDELYGLGVCDMKGGIAAFLIALTEMNLTKLKRGIKVYITYDEEIAFAGIKEICKIEKEFPKYNIIGEPTDNIMMTGCKGLLAVEFFTEGIKVHSSVPDKGKSANDKMINLLYELRKFYEIKIKSYENNAYEVPYTTMNIGLINGGCGINSVSPQCSSYVDFRISNEKHIQILKDKINDLCEKYNAHCNIDIEIKPFLEKVSFVNEIHTAGFMTEASFITGKRIILGPGPVTAHEVNEHISIKSFQETIEQYKMIIKKVCM